MSRLTLALLGPPEMRHGGQAPAFRTRKTSALLFYLVVENHLHSREHLLALLWPDSDAAHGRALLRRTLANLRDTLGEPDDPAAPHHLLVVRDQLGVHPQADTQLDLLTVHRAWQAARNPPGRAESPPANLAPLLQTALACRRGEFLAGFTLPDAPEFDSWAQVQRETWQRRLLLICDRLSQLQLDAGQFAEAVETAGGWIAQDPLDETAYRRLMAVYFAAGDRAAALQAFERCRAALAADLHLVPAPETVALAERIRAAGPPPRPRPVERGGRALLVPDTPLVGRAVEFGQMCALYQAARLDGLQVMVLEGEAGIGKTRLAQEFLGWATSQGAVVLRGRAFETAGTLPYEPVVEALRPYIAQENAPADLLDDTWLVELSRLLPELRQRYPDLAAPGGDETTARAQLFEAVACLGAALAARAPLVLALDDVQWSDAASRDLLHYVARRWAESPTPVLLILCLRAEAAQAQPAVAEWLARLGRDVRLIKLTLPPLTATDTQYLLQRLGLAAVPPDDAAPAEVDLQALGAWLFAETRGQPFYMVETIKALSESGVLAPGRGPGGDPRLTLTGPLREEALRGLMPPGVREVIRSRLARLTPDGLALLAAGAVLGYDFAFERLAQVAGLAEDAALAALDQVLAGRLLREAGGPGDSAGAYSFVHDKIRDVVYTEAGAARRRVFHRRALETAPPGTPAADLARHAQAAGLRAGAFRHTLAAGDAALHLFAVRDALAHYEQARRLAQEPGESIPTAELQHLYSQLGRSHELNNDLEAASAVYAVMLETGRERGDPVLQSGALSRLATNAAQHHGDPARAIDLLEQARDMVAEVDLSLLAEVEWNLAQVNFYARRPAQAIVHGERALGLAQDRDLPELVARSWNVLAIARLVAGQWPAGAAAAQAARAGFAALGNRAMEADSLTVMCTTQMLLGRLAGAVAAGQEALAISRAIANPWGLIYGISQLAIALLDAGAVAEAQALAEEGVAVARSHRVPLLLSMVLTALGTVYRGQGAFAAARAAHAEAMALNKALVAPPFTEPLAGELAADCALAGDWDAAYHHAQMGLEQRTDMFYSFTGLVRGYETEALLRGGTPQDVVAADVARFGVHIQEGPRYRIPYLHAQAVLARWAGGFAEARTYLRDALALAQAIGLPGEAARLEATLDALPS